MPFSLPSATTQDTQRCALLSERMDVWARGKGTTESLFYTRGVVTPMHLVRLTGVQPPDYLTPTPPPTRADPPALGQLRSRAFSVPCA